MVEIAQTDLALQVRENRAGHGLFALTSAPNRLTIVH